MYWKHLAYNSPSLRSISLAAMWLDKVYCCNIFLVRFLFDNYKTSFFYPINAFNVNHYLLFNICLVWLSHSFIFNLNLLGLKTGLLDLKIGLKKKTEELRESRITTQDPSPMITLDGHWLNQKRLLPRYKTGAIRTPGYTRRLASKRMLLLWVLESLQLESVSLVEGMSLCYLCLWAKELFFCYKFKNVTVVIYTYVCMCIYMYIYIQFTIEKYALGLSFPWVKTVFLFLNLFSDVWV